VLGGDQIYADQVEREMLSALENPKNWAQTLMALRRRFIRQYQRYWGDPRYRRVMARVPSVAMWDDHDITDGWGSRDECFQGDGDEIKLHWVTYYKVAREAFAAYQASRNPPPLPGVPPEAFTTCLDLGAERLYLLDLRTERNARRRVVWSTPHEQAFMTSLRQLPDEVRRAFVLTPVVAVRTAFEADRRLTALTKWMFRKVRDYEARPLRRLAWRSAVALLASGVLAWPVMEWFYPRERFLLGHYLLAEVAVAAIALAWLVPELLAHVPFLPKLTDDIVDGWSSEVNVESLKRFLAALFEWQGKTGRRAVLLSGDVHLAGLSEIVEERDGRRQAIPQVVSSPITNAPTPKVAAGLTTSTSEIVLARSASGRLFARNVLYVSRRNFAQVFPSRLTSPETEPPVLFHLEGHAAPLAMHASFLPPAVAPAPLAAPPVAEEPAPAAAPVEPPAAEPAAQLPLPTPEPRPAPEEPPPPPRPPKRGRR
jgi:hypothetical protein